ncbi:hypothetical protein YPPY63_1924, partial [Yersinia pestis PY-63]
MRFIAGK